MAPSFALPLAVVSLAVALGAAPAAARIAISLDPFGFGDGAAYCALGKYYGSMPGLFGGSKSESEEPLRRCLAYDPDRPLGHHYLGPTLVALDRRTEAIAALRATVDAPPGPEYAPEGRLVKERAQRLLAKVTGSDATRGEARRPTAVPDRERVETGCFRPAPRVSLRPDRGPEPHGPHSRGEQP